MTTPIMKTDVPDFKSPKAGGTIICAMPVPEKFVPEFKPTTVTKKGNSEPVVKTSDDDRIICKMPVQEKFEFKPTKIIQEFECEYPSVDANVARERQPLPFPEKLNDVIAWTDAFVDRIASLTVAQEKVSLRSTSVPSMKTDTNILCRNRSSR